QRAQRPEALLELDARGRQLLFETLPLSVIPCEATRMHELAAAPQHVRVDEHVPDRAVLAAQPRLIVPDRLAASQPFENVLDRRLVDVKLSYGPPDVLVGFIPEQFPLGAVRLQDRPVRTHPV